MAYWMTPNQTTAVTAALLVATGFVQLVNKLYHRRFKQNAHFPQLLTSLLFGHLIVFNDFIKRGAEDRHLGKFILAGWKVWQATDATSDRCCVNRDARGSWEADIFLVDNWPIVRPMAVIASHQVAEQVSRPSMLFQYSVPKSSSLDHAFDLIGTKSILRKQA